VTSKAKQISNVALLLPSKDRAILADSLLVSLDRPDSKIDAKWKSEAETRVKAYVSGQAPAVSLSKVLMSYRKKKVA
jgi:hypothetical protein